MKRIIRLTEKDLTRIVKRVIQEQSTPPGVNPALKPDFDTMKSTGTDSDASNNKFWKELKPEIERLTGKKFTRKKQSAGGLFYGPVVKWEEDSIGNQNPYASVKFWVQYPTSAIDAGSGNDGNFITIYIDDPKTEVNLTGSCFDLSGIQTASAAQAEGSVKDGFYMATVKVWCKKQILDLIKSGLK
jgi:hypothetical protein